MARTGYTLPVFAVAAAKAALLHLRTPQTLTPNLQVRLDLLPNQADIPIQQVAQINEQSALAITVSDPGDNLDLTRNTPLWAWVQLQERQTEPLILLAGAGLGRTTEGTPAIYQYARQLFAANLQPLIPNDRTVVVTIILPEGRQLAQRTSNEAFGILEGLSLLGTSGISQPLSAENHLQELQHQLQRTLHHEQNLVFCIGSYGIQVAQKLAIPAAAIVQTGNWIGTLLVEAGLRGASSITLLGYQGKLIKLAGGIFNTSSHLADAKLEIISSAIVQTGGALETARAVLQAPTADAAYDLLVKEQCADLVFSFLSKNISHRAEKYIQKYANISVEINTVLLNRRGQIIAGEIQSLWL